MDQYGSYHLVVYQFAMEYIGKPRGNTRYVMELTHGFHYKSTNPRVVHCNH